MSTEDMEEVLSLGVKMEEQEEELLEDIHEEGEYSNDYLVDEVRDDELEQILQQTVPLDHQIDPIVTKTETKTKTSISFTSLPNPEEEAKTSKKREREAGEEESPAVPKNSPAKLKVLPLDALLKRERPVKYFIMKSVDTKNLAIALSKNIWSTQAHNETKLREAYKENEVILIFSVNGSGGFQGYARMVSGIGSKSCSIWEKDSGKWGGLFYLEWICQKEVQFHKCHGMHNSYNENLPIKVSRDGQELEQAVAYKLCKILDQGTEYDVNDLINKHLPPSTDKKQNFKRSKNDNDQRDSNKTSAIPSSATSTTPTTNSNKQRQNSYTPQNKGGSSSSRDQQPTYKKSQGFVPNTITSTIILPRNMIESPQSAMNPLFTLGPLAAISYGSSSRMMMNEKGLISSGNPFTVPYTSEPMGMNSNRGTTFYRTNGPPMNTNSFVPKIHINPNLKQSFDMGMPMIGYNGGMLQGMRNNNYNNNYNYNNNNNFDNDLREPGGRYRSSGNNYKNSNYHNNNNNNNNNNKNNSNNNNGPKHYERKHVKSEAIEVVANSKNRTETTYYADRNKK
jgi:hypothetical protein